MCSLSSVLCNGQTKIYDSLQFCVLILIRLCVENKTLLFCRSQRRASSRMELGGRH